MLNTLDHNSKYEISVINDRSKTLINIIVHYT